MFNQKLKNFYFAINRWAVLPATWLARWRYRNPPAEGLAIHLGCGEKYIAGMVNVDGYRLRKIDVWLDLRNDLPFPDRSASFVYCSHTLEHFYVDEATHLLREIHRVLRDDGTARIAVPSLEHALEIAAGHPAEDPQRRFEHAHGQAVDYLFCDGQHKYGYSFSIMSEFARQAGFTRVVNYSAEHGVAPKRYGNVEVGNELAGSLVVELGR